jgi:hypothetical protein
MTRRALFRLFAAAPLAAVVDPEKLLWTPGAKLISIPAVAPVPVRVPLHDLCEWYSRHVLMSLEDKLRFAHLLHQNFVDQVKVGDTIAIPIHRPFPGFPMVVTISRPPRYRAFTKI